MKLKAVQQQFFDVLEGSYDKDEIRSFFFMLTETYYNIKRIDLAMDPNLSLTHASPMVNALSKLKLHVPIQYILGTAAFFGLNFKVDSNVLIPRPETEELVSWILNNWGFNEAPYILDIGTGSGCIAITLAKHMPKAKVFAMDKSTSALTVAKANAALNHVDVMFFLDDILTPNHENPIWSLQQFDIIVSNPPYVRKLEKALMHPNVVNHEPHMALFVENDNALEFYEAIAKFGQQKLKPKGQLFFEINEYFGNETIHVLEAYNYTDIQLQKDSFGKDRMIKSILL